MVHDNIEHAKAACYACLPRSDTDLKEASEAIAPILHEIASLMSAIGMQKEDLKAYIIRDGRCLVPFINYIFDKFVPEFAVLTPDDYYKLTLETYLNKF